MRTKWLGKLLFLPVLIMLTCIFPVLAYANNDIASNRDIGGVATQTLGETPGERRDTYNNIGMTRDGYDAPTVIDEPGASDDRTDLRELNRSRDTETGIGDNDIDVIGLL